MQINFKIEPDLKIKDEMTKVTILFDGHDDLVFYTKSGKEHAEMMVFIASMLGATEEEISNVQFHEFQ